jgi:hypothetical protein
MYTKFQIQRLHNLKDTKIAKQDTKGKKYNTILSFLSCIMIFPFLYLLKYNEFVLEFWFAYVSLSHLQTCQVLDFFETSKYFLKKVFMIAPNTWFPLHIFP